MADASLMISAKDNYSETLLKMARTTESFTRDLNGLQARLTQLNTNRLTLKVDMAKASSALKTAKKDFAAVSDEQNRLQLESAQANYDNLKQNLDMISRAARQTQNEMHNLTGTMSKAETRAGGFSATIPEAGKASLTSRLGQAGVWSQLGGILGDLAGTYVSSAFGSRAGTYFSSALSTGATGAAIGTMIAPGVGTLVGAAIGGGLGLLQGSAEIFKKEEDFFKSLVQEKYNNVTSAQAEALQSGSTTAGGRETSLISFTTLFGGNRGQAQKFLDQVRDFANVTPFQYDDLTSMAKVLKTYGYGVDELMPEMQRIGDAGAALGLNQESMSMIATYIGRMRSTDKTTLEYLNPLMERGIPALDYLSTSLGKSKAEVYEMVSKGLIPGSKAAKIISDYMGKAFSGSMDEQSRTYEDLMSTLLGMETEMDNALGAAYNERRKEGIQEQIAWYQGESGKEMQKAYGYIGEFEASLENEKEKILREKMSAVMATEEFEAASAADRGRMLMEARVEAEADYSKTEGYQIKLEAEKQLVDGLQSAMSDTYYNFGYKMGEKFDEGLNDARAEWAMRHYVAPSAGPDPGMAGYSTGGNYAMYDDSIYGLHAYGLSRVPYNGYPALLHEGERVLTASQAREADRGGAKGVTVVVQSMTVRQESDIDRIAAELLRRIQSAAEIYIGGA